jgi:3-hydroxyanthranilate 3,4-dioxygenase
MSVPSPLNFKRWIEENRHLLKPPVGNRRIFRDSQFIVMAVGGPNSRKDYHVDPGEEFFYQVEGELLLKTVQGDAVVDIHVREGDLFLLPAGIPHSPRRGAHTIGLVIERDRRPGEEDGLQWYCENCGTKLYEEFFPLTNIETQFPPAFERFYGNPQLFTCRTCGTVQTR